MSILARDKRQLTYIYSSASQLGKQVLGYIHAIDKKVDVIDISKDKLGDTIWVELSENLGIPLDEIITIPDNQKDDFGTTDDFDTEDWIKIINNNPELLQKPIAVNKERVMLISHRSEILKFFGVDSAGLKKTFSHEDPTISSTTKDEDFM
ncbi:hypothetical protein [Algibacter sp. 2305UL17-15]|uniref:arsenate reductase family protein n=1 Tax=Algibacter sp. 2305UL17-15 TaxID=3231268 RepID=UPI003459532A